MKSQLGRTDFGVTSAVLRVIIQPAKILKTRLYFRQTRITSIFPESFTRLRKRGTAAFSTYSTVSPAMYHPLSGKPFVLLGKSPTSDLQWCRVYLCRVQKSMKSVLQKFPVPHVLSLYSRLNAVTGNLG